MSTLSKHRIESLDLLKGLVIVIMALDHVRDYFHDASYLFDPTDPIKTTLPIYFTRFITNFCAPTFSFLAGVSAFIVGKRKAKQELSIFLLQRGLWLVFVELVIMMFGWHFDPNYRNIFAGVIWVLGISMICLAGLIHLSRNAILVFSCVLILGHNLLDYLPVTHNIVWKLLHERNELLVINGHHLKVGYPMIPWVAVMSLGYYFGAFYNKDVAPEKRRVLFNKIGIAAIVGCLLLRASNVYGNFLPWLSYSSPKATFVSFFNLTKYPPSLLYLLLTLGVALVFLANSEKIRGKFVDFFCVFGRVPFFFYILHIYLIHLLALVAAQMTGFGWQQMILSDLPFRVDALKGFGFNLGVVYLVWALVIAILYPLCKKFDTYKQQHKQQWWLSYL